MNVKNVFIAAFIGLLIAIIILVASWGSILVVEEITTLETTVEGNITIEIIQTEVLPRAVDKVVILCITTLVALATLFGAMGASYD